MSAPPAITLHPRRILAVLLAVGAAAAGNAWHAQRPVEVPLADLAEAIPLVDAQWMEGMILVIAVEEDWADLPPQERTEQMVFVMDKTGALSWDTMEIRGRHGACFATMDEDWNIEWYGGIEGWALASNEDD